MTEKQLQEAVIEAAGYLGYRHFHAFDMRRSDVGFPDLLLLRERDGRCYAIECKSSTGRPTSAQLDWIAAFAACGIPAMIVRPIDLDTVLEMLK
jgi:hypothetical protein